MNGWMMRNLCRRMMSESAAIGKDGQSTHYRIAEIFARNAETQRCAQLEPK